VIDEGSEMSAEGWRDGILGRVRGKARAVAIAMSGMAVIGGLLLAPAGAGAVEGAAEFYVRGADLTGVSCAMYDGYGGSPIALCEYVSKRTQTKATVRPNGSVVLCRTDKITSNRCGLGNAGEGSPTYRVGKTVTVGRFTCTVESDGVACVVGATGKGFLLGTKKLRGVGGATVRWR
jgi:hypothetical protein